MIISASRIITGGTDLGRGWIRIEGERIAATGLGDPPGPADLTAPIAVPGLVDVHCHGGGGSAFSDGDPLAPLAVHRAAGTTTTIASLVTDTVPAIAEQVRELVPAVRSGELAGIHLEGPWLAKAHKGAHAEDLLRDPVREDVDLIFDAGEGTVAMVTLAVERDAGFAQTRHMVERGALVAVGHSAADLATTQEAIAAGVRGVTHLFNGLPPMLHRAPGPVLAALEEERVWLELIADGHHVAPDLVAYVMTTHPDRAVLVTDAMAAAGADDGLYDLGPMKVRVEEGLARTVATGSIAGSTLVLLNAVQNVVAWGIELPQAVLAATELPARYLGLAGVGRLEPGALADVLVLEDDLSVAGVIRRGLRLS